MRIGIKRSDGGLSVMTLLDGFALEDVPREITKWEHVVPWTAIRWQEIDEAAVPPRLFRNAYELGEKVPEINMVKARDIHRDAMRVTRAPLLENLDIEFQRAYKDPAEQDRIETEKQTLRDVTDDPAINIAKTPEELKAIWPEVLKG